MTSSWGDKLIKAFPLVLQEFPETKLVILGVGDMENSLHSLVEQLGLQGKVILRTEFVNEEERILHFGAADVVVVPSLYEPFGIVCTEAMSMAKPVIVGARGTSGLREQIIPSGSDQCGIHIDPFNPEDIAWGIKQVLTSKEKGTQMGKNGRERVKKHFSWDVVAKKTLAVYSEFLNK